MKKEENRKNGEEFPLFDYEKEALKDRLWALIGSRSVRAAAKDWGLAFSTLNNYLTRGTDPALKVVHKIAQIENASLEWLASGVGSVRKTDRYSDDKNLAAWIKAYEALTPVEIDKLLKLIQRNGVTSLLMLTNEENLELMSLSNQSKKIAILTKNLPSERLKEISEFVENSGSGLPVAIPGVTERKVAG